MSKVPGPTQIAGDWYSYIKNSMLTGNDQVEQLHGNTVKLLDLHREYTQIIEEAEIRFDKAEVEELKALKLDQKLINYLHYETARVVLEAAKRHSNDRAALLRAAGQFYSELQAAHSEFAAAYARLVVKSRSGWLSGESYLTT